MKPFPIRFLKIFISILFLTVFTFSSVIIAQKLESPSLKNKKTAFNEQEIKPTVDGFVAQSSGAFNTTLAYADLKKGTGFNREIYMTYDY